MRSHVVAAPRGHTVPVDVSGQRARIGPGRRPRADWERRVEHAIRHPQSAWDLREKSLCRLTAVGERARRSYPEHPGADALALRDLVTEAVSLAGDLLDPQSATFLRCWVATGNIAAVAREMGRDRSHVSRHYRPRVVMVVTEVFMRLTGNGQAATRGLRPRKIRLSP